MSFPQRLQRLKDKVRRKGLDALLVSKLPNVKYLSGFSGTEAMMLVTGERSIFITDFRYIEQAQEECQGLEVVERRKTFTQVLVWLVRRLGLRKMGFDAESLNFAQYSELMRSLGKRRMVPVKGLVERMREIKDEGELEKTREAIRVAEDAFDRLRDRLSSDLTEREVANHLEFNMKNLGADAPAFNTICAVAERASLPHSPLTDRKLLPGEPILIDWGARCKSYNSDLTRVLFHNRIASQARTIYKIVLDAQARAIEGIREGVSAREVDLAARTYIEKKGYGRNFGHGLGHGIGLEVHESPRLNRTNRRPLRRGMVITVEPGIYIPRWGGVRIEDMVLVKEGGCEVLSHTPRGLDGVII